jgi:heptose I phosphotransferase
LTRFQVESLDSGKLVINGAFGDLLRRHGWQTFDTIWSKTVDAAIAKKMRTDRITLRFTLDDQGVERSFYIKRHVRSSWKEYLKPLLRLTWPILGARNEWNAILDFHEAGLPTMTPVALGESGSNSFLITEGLEGCEKLSKLKQDGESPQAIPATMRARLIREVAHLARRMHEAGLHHQDFYLGHIMQSQQDPSQLYIIDLGRVQRQKKLSRRWIVKDLAQLDFSADASNSERLRFLREYLGRPLAEHDKPLMASIKSKNAAIARHSRKNRL